MQSTVDKVTEGRSATGERVSQDKLLMTRKTAERLPSIVAITVLPFIAVVLFTAGGSGAVNFAAYALVVSAAGYGLLSVTGLSRSEQINLAFAPAAGVLTVSALTALWVRLDFPVCWCVALWLVLAAAGSVMAWRERSGWLKSTVQHGRTLAVLSILICLVYFLPSARNDLVFGKDGSFKWMFIDSQHFHAIAASVKDSGSPPKTPGTATAELLYHFAPYAPAAGISRVDGLELGDAVARVTRGASLWALMLSCFGLGTLLSMRATGGLFGGIASEAG